MHKNMLGNATVATFYFKNTAWKRVKIGGQLTHTLNAFSIGSSTMAIKDSASLYYAGQNSRIIVEEIVEKCIQKSTEKFRQPLDREPRIDIAASIVIA